MPKRTDAERLPIRTSFQTKVPGLEVQDNRTGERYTMGPVDSDTVTLIDVDNNEIEVDSNEFDDRYSLC